MFAGALQEAGFTSWVGSDISAPTDWLAAKWGDVYLHETVISHIRRLLDTTYVCDRLRETAAHLRARMVKVADHLNSPEFAAAGGSGLEGLAKDMPNRCKEVIRLKGERLPK